MPDFRWNRADIKTVMLLPACLAKEAARAGGADEAWFLDSDGFVTEGASSNAWIVDGAGRLRTHPRSKAILAGVTRATLLDLLTAEGIKLLEEPFRCTEAMAAREAFVTSASGNVMAVQDRRARHRRRTPGRCHATIALKIPSGCRNFPPLSDRSNLRVVETLPSPYFLLNLCKRGGLLFCSLSHIIPAACGSH
jgi:hypothetical protein